MTDDTRECGRGKPSGDTLGHLSSGDLLADRRYLYARELMADGEHGAAADLFAQALERVPTWAPGWFALGDAHAAAGDVASAAQAYRETARLDIGGALGAALALAALGDGVPASAPRGYISALFDGYAPRFDAHLSGALGYRGPALLRDAIGTAAPGRRFARAWDLGCGTGLAGEALRPLVDWLGGVDLSSAMIEAARAKGLYDTLRVGEMREVLDPAAPVDLVVAADVLVYHGDLRPICQAVAAALRPGGLFALTLQRAPDAQDVVVWPDRRFAHSVPHLRSRATDSGFDTLVCTEASTRRDAGVDVPGLIAVLRRPDGVPQFGRTWRASESDHTPDA